MKNIAVLQAASAHFAQADLILDWATNLANINVGMMSAMQTNMSDETTDCYYAA